ncbi:MAG: glycosyltransferase family 87 protein [Terracidiphilus sp.]
MILILSFLLFIVTGAGLQRGTQGLLDFKVLYYGAKCLVHHCDPYNVSDLTRFFVQSGGELPTDPPIIRHVVTTYVYLPTAFLVTAPFSLLPWGVSHVLWTTLTTLCFCLGAYLVWAVSPQDAPVLSALLIGLVVAGSEVIFGGGNAVGFAVSLCAIAACCFYQERFAIAGVACLATSLLLKPQDAGLVWLYFLLAGGLYRKRALQTLALTAVLTAGSVAWVSHVAPNWLHEQEATFTALSTHGEMDDPGPGSTIDRTPGMVIDLQSVISIYRNEPKFYNTLAYLMAAILLLPWVVKTVCSKRNYGNTWIALAAISALSMLVTYHKPYDAKLLILSVPACVMLWMGGGRIGRAALAVNLLAFLVTADVPLAILVIATTRMRFGASGFLNKSLQVLVTRPASIALFLMAVFYLWVYWKRPNASEEAA